MVRNILVVLVVAFGVAACGGPSTVRRGATLPPPGETQLSPQDAAVQWPGAERDRQARGSY